MITESHRDAIKNCYNFALTRMDKLQSFKKQLEHIGICDFEYVEFHYGIRMVEFSTCKDYVGEYISEFNTFRESEFFENYICQLEDGFNFYAVDKSPHVEGKNKILELQYSISTNPYTILLLRSKEKVINFKCTFINMDAYYQFLQKPDKKNAVIHFVYFVKDKLQREIQNSFDINKSILQSVSRRIERGFDEHQEIVLPEAKRFYFDFLPKGVYLTPKETQVLLAHYRGLSAKVAARNIGISNRTFELHLTHIREKAEHRNVIALIQQSPSDRLFFQSR